jgi:hypothetical protein
MIKEFKLNAQERNVIFLGLLAREREINQSIVDSKKYGLVNLDMLQSELKECLELQKRIG